MPDKDHTRTRIPTVFADALKSAFPQAGSIEACVYLAIKEFFRERGTLSLPSHPEPKSLYPHAPLRPRANRARVQKMRVGKPRRMRRARRG